MAKSENSVDQTILYLRPQAANIEVLDNPANQPWLFTVAPPPEPVDTPLEGCDPPQDHGRGSRESTPDPDPISQRVLRLGFDSIEKPSARGFEFGSQPNSDVNVPCYGRSPIVAYFRIHYNFDSGALLITALHRIRLGSAILKKQQSLVLVAGTSIRCGGNHEFIVEFPDISNCLEEYKRNYQKYTAKVGFPDAPYLISFREDSLQLGLKHKSVAILGKGAFGEVHKAIK